MQSEPPSLDRSESGRQYLVRSEAVVQLNDPHLVPTLPFLEASLRKDLAGAVLGHSVAYNIHRTPAFERGLVIGRQSLSNDLDGLVLQPMLVDEVLGRNDAAAATILEIVSGDAGVKGRPTCGSRTAHELGQLLRDLRCREDLLDRPAIAELGVRVVDGMLVILASCGHTHSVSD